MQSPRDLAHLFERRVEIPLKPLQPVLLRRAIVRAGGARGPGHIKGERDQTLLDTVMEVALNPLACFLTGSDDARARGDELRARGGVRDCGCDELGVRRRAATSDPSGNGSEPETTTIAPHT